jgi:hypothetical protein
VTMSNEDVHVVTYDVLDAAVSAGSILDAITAVRGDLEVLSREDLVRVAMALAVETTQKLIPPVDRPRFRDRLDRARLSVMWSGA